MSEQVEMTFTGQALKDKGIDLVLSNNAGWHDAVRKLIRRLCQERPEFTAEDLRTACESHAIPQPRHPNAWGAAINKASKEGLIELTGYRKNKMASAHARVVGVWRKRI